MFKKVILLFLSSSILAVEDTKPELTQTEKVVLVGSLGIGAAVLAVIAAPYVLSAGTITSIKVGATTVATKIAALPAMTKISVGITVVHKAAETARPYIAPTEQEKLAELKKQESIDKQEAKRNVVACMEKCTFQQNPHRCQEALRIFHMMGGKLTKKEYHD